MCVSANHMLKSAIIESDFLLLKKPNNNITWIIFCFKFADLFGFVFCFFPKRFFVNTHTYTRTYAHTHIKTHTHDTYENMLYCLWLCYEFILKYVWVVCNAIIGNFDHIQRFVVGTNYFFDVYCVCFVNLKKRTASDFNRIGWIHIHIRDDVWRKWNDFIAWDIQIGGDGTRQRISSAIAYGRSANRCRRSCK